MSVSGAWDRALGCAPSRRMASPPMRVTIAHVSHAAAPHASDYLQFILAARPRLSQT